MPQSNSVVVVLGVHRSGTSLTARVLNVLGIRFGDKLVPGRRDNPAGFWEHSEIVQQSKSIEAKLGVDPFKGGLVVPPRSEWWDDETIAPERAALTEILKQEVASGDSIFGFKDPRTLILLPLWQRIFEDAGITPRYVLALRQPADAIASMMRRGVSDSAAETVWLAHLAEGLRALDRPPEIAISYELWFEGPEAQAQAIVEALALPASNGATGELGKAIRADLRHFTGANAPFLSPLTEELYASASACTNGSFDAVRDLAQRTSEAVRLPAELLGQLRREPFSLRDQFEVERRTLQDERRSLQDEIDRLLRHQAAANSPTRPKKLRDVRFPGISSIRAVRRRTAHPLNVCIATEDIVGPVRNGGIGTTYTHLSFLLAEAGHRVTILYLRGSDSADHSIEHWVEWYRERGVRFVPVDPPQDIASPARRWLAPMIALYERLKAEHFDLVHVSEWRGSAYYSLLAKKQGLAFRNTVFCVKSSSPYLWNRQHMLGPVDDTAQLVKIFAERRSIELADMVIGGSQHLLNWMMNNGYELPKGRTFVQPNVTVPANIDPDLLRNRPEPGSRVPVKEIVFFGRLEGRKGLDVFCDAIHKLVLEEKKVPKVTFLGKFGARIATHPELTVREYIRSQASSWGVEWDIIDNYGQSEALTYLLGEGRLAVMPSLIENSSLAIYETTHLRVPFVASDGGGNPELIAKDHRAAVLTPPHPVPLSEKLAEAIDIGGFVAAPSFNNSENLAIWSQFHATLSTIIDEAKNGAELLEDASAAEDQATRDLIKQLRHNGAPRLPVTISVCVDVHDNHKIIQAGLLRLIEQTKLPAEVLIINSGSQKPITLKKPQHEAEQTETPTSHVLIANDPGEWPLTREQLEAQRERFAEITWKVFNRPHYSTTESRNFVASKATGTHFLFLEPGAALKPNALATLHLAASCSEADVLVSFYEESNGRNGSRAGPRRVVSIPGDPCYPFFDVGAGWAPLVLVSKKAFETLGGFTTDYKVAGDIEEFLMHAVTAGLTVEVVPEVLAAWDASVTRTDRLNVTGASFRTIRPHLNAVPANLQPLLLMSRTMSVRGGRIPSVPKVPKKPRGGGIARKIRKIPKNPLWYVGSVPLLVPLGRSILPEGVRRRLVVALSIKPGRPMPRR
jgi:glycosyltransferase involved in cell wall biosynthesis